MRVADTITQLKGEAQRLSKRVDHLERLLTGATTGDSVTHPSIKMIIEETAKLYRVSPINIRSQRRTKDITFPRQVAMYLAREMTLLSSPSIGRAIGGRDHTTVIYGGRKIEKLLQRDEKLQHEIRHLQKLITERHEAEQSMAKQAA